MQEVRAVGAQLAAVRLVTRLERWSSREAKVRAIAETLWTRDPLSFLAICAGAHERGMTLLARIRQRMAELEASR